MPIKEPIAEQFYSQVSESIKLVFDLTSRIDERVKMLVERQNDVEVRLDKFLDLQQQLIHRVAVLETKDVSAVKTEVADLSRKVAVIESQEDQIDEMKETIHTMKNKLHLLELKCETLQLKEAGHDRKWTVIFDFVFRMAFIVGGGFLLWKFGWQAPPTP